MIKPIWAIAGVALLGTAGIASAIVVASTGGEEEVVQTQGTATASAAASESATASAPSAPSNTPVSTPGDTLTYTDPTYGYSFDYPSTWYLSLGGTAGSITLYSYDPATAKDVGAVPPDKLKVFFWVAEGVDKPLEQWLAEGKNSPGQITPPTVLSQHATAAGGREGLVELIESDGIKSIGYYIPIGGTRVFAVNAIPADSQVWPQFEPVLDSIRFAP